MSDDLTAKQAAVHCHCSPLTIKVYARLYRKSPDHALGLKGRKGPKGWRFTREALDDWLMRYDEGRR